MTDSQHEPRVITYEKFRELMRAAYDRGFDNGYALGAQFSRLIEANESREHDASSDTEDV